jgi:hypothetical protein
MKVVIEVRRFISVKIDAPKSCDRQKNYRYDECVFEEVLASHSRVRVKVV